MKKYLLALVLVSFTTICMSQEIRYGVRGAINVSNLDFDPDATFVNQHRNGFAFAGFVDFGLTDKISVLTELQWSAEGAKEVNLRADYLKLPVMLRLMASDRLTLGVGPQLGVKTWKNKDGFAPYTFSGVIGAEYMITDELFVDARATYGVTDILHSNPSDLSAKNHVLQFGFGIKI